MPLFTPAGTISGNSSVGGNLSVTGTSLLSGAVTASAGISTTGDESITSGNLLLNTLGKSLRVKEGSNACMGTGTLNGTTEVTVSTTAVTANSRVFITVETPGGTVGGAAYVSSRIAGTSFGVKGLVALDTSTFAWVILEPA